MFTFRSNTVLIQIGEDDRYRSIVFVNKHYRDALTLIYGTYVERCELNPIVFQIFYWEAKVWVEGFHHPLRVRAEGRGQRVRWVCETCKK